METLALLVPKSDLNVKRWFLNVQKKHKIDTSVICCGHIRPEWRSIGHYTYWGNRLRDLKAAYDNHEPQGPLQWWRDDRKPVQWWTFWVAVLVLFLTIVFGVIQSVTGILQVIRR